MRRSSSSLPWFLLWSVLLALTLRPPGWAGGLVGATLERTIDFAALPLRAMGELALPLTVVKKRRVAAAEELLAARAESEEEASRRLLRDLALSSLPTEPGLLVKRRAVHAEVLGRDPGNADLLIVRVRDVRGIAAGQPVACGNAYVGRLRDVDAAGIARIDLVTGPDFHIGARVDRPRRSNERGEAGEVLMTVGGLASGLGAGSPGRRSEQIRLAVHNPSDRSLVGGLVRVSELYGEEQELGELAEGLRLGEIVRGEKEWGIAPELDYRDGLFHVVVLCSPDPLFGTNVPFEPVLRDAHWVRAGHIGVGDPSSYRSTAKLRVGRKHGVLEGAAVSSSGAQLVGRVTHAGYWTSDVSYPDDPGFHVLAVARIEGVSAPRVLGRLISLGRDPTESGTRFRWIVRVDLGLAESAGPAMRRAQLFTGSGDFGLPAGFSLGTTELPVGARPGEEVILEVLPEVDPRSVRSLSVRTTFELGAGARDGRGTE